MYGSVQANSAHAVMYGTVQKHVRNYTMICAEYSLSHQSLNILKLVKTTQVFHQEIVKENVFCMEKIRFNIATYSLTLEK